MGQFDFWKWFWRGFGVVAFLFMVFCAVLFWTSWRANPLKPVSDGQALAVGIDVIAIQLDILSLIIAVMGIGLAVMGFIGYQAIKAAAIARADEVATAAFALHMEKYKSGTDGGTQPPIEPGDVTELTDEKGE